MLCLTELKGSDVRRATQQIINTHRHIKRRFNGRLDEGANWKAYILLSGRSPRRIKKLKQQLLNEFGSGNAGIKRNEDIGPFLRG